MVPTPLRFRARFASRIGRRNVLGGRSPVSSIDDRRTVRGADPRPERERRRFRASHRRRTSKSRLVAAVLRLRSMSRSRSRVRRSFAILCDRAEACSRRQTKRRASSPHACASVRKSRSNSRSVVRSGGVSDYSLRSPVEALRRRPQESGRDGRSIVSGLRQRPFGSFRHVSSSSVAAMRRSASGPSPTPVLRAPATSSHAILAILMLVAETLPNRVTSSSGA